MELKEIRQLIDLMKKNGLSVFKMEKEGFKITLKTDAAPHSGSVQFPSFAYNAGAPSNAPTLAPSSIGAPEPEAVPLREITAPMVGTFYTSPSPDSPPYVQVGQEVTPDTVVCIVEAMKVMNEIKSEVSGIVAEVAAEDGKPVQFGQPLFRLR